VWHKLLGFFGEGLLRKFSETPPDEWVEAIAELNDFQLRRGFRRLTFGWKGGVPNLPDFVRFCRAIGDDAPDEGPVERVPVPALEGPNLDGWDIAGNVRLWKYVTRRLTEVPRAWGAPKSTQLEESTRIIVAYKNAWAQDMRELSGVEASTGEIVQPPEDELTRHFDDCMKRAETDIAVLLRGKAA
jgi:hypothetical protein